MLRVRVLLLVFIVSLEFKARYSYTVKIMPLFKPSALETRLEASFLREKLDSYEQLSKGMFDRMDKIISKLSETNNNISLILAKHEGRIDQTEKDGMLVTKTLEIHDKRIEDLVRLRWLSTGVLLAAGFFIGQIGPVYKIFHPEPETTTPPQIQHSGSASEVTPRQLSI